MSQTDFWFIRFPDGRILRAASTTIVRQELDAGHIPIGSTVRRSPHEEWVLLQWTQEFAEQVTELSARSAAAAEREPRRRAAPRGEPAGAAPDRAATVGSRLDAARLNLVGVRGYVEELLAALDSTLVAKKLLIGLIVGLFLGAVVALRRAAWFEQDSRWLAMAWTLVLVGGVVLDLLTGLLTRLSYVELAQLRPARWREGFAGLGPLTFRILVSQGIVRGSAWGLIVLLRWLPYWLGPGADEPWTMGQQIAAGTTLTVGMVLESLLWPVFFFWWLLPAVMVVEDCSLGQALRQWLTLLRRQLGRVFLYQAMAGGLGLLVTAPFLLLIAPLFLPTFVPPEALADVVGPTRCLLLGLACAPLLTYWIVANLFVYLNLRYGASGRR